MVPIFFSSAHALMVMEGARIEKKPGENTKKGTHVGLADNKKGPEKQPVREENKSNNKNIGNGRVKIAFKLFLKNGYDISHGINLLSW